MKSILLLFMALMLSISTYTLSAQNADASLNVLCVNATNGEEIPFANIILKNNAHQIITGTLTQANGRATITGIDAGEYTVEVSFIGFTTERIANIALKAGDTETLNMFLTEEVTQLEECVVTYKAPLIDKTCCRLYRTDENICCFNCCRMVVDTTTSPVLHTDSISMYPNPSNGALHIQSQHSLDNIIITNMNGQEVARLDGKNQTDFDAHLGYLPPASYVVHFIRGGQKVSKIWILVH